MYQKKNAYNGYGNEKHGVYMWEKFKKKILKRKTMRNRQIKIIIFICLLIFYGCIGNEIIGNGISVEALSEQDLYAKGALLMDADSRRVLFEKNGYEKMSMASTTKIMTCLLALELGDMEQVVEFSSYAASRPKVHLGVRAGMKFYMKDLLYSLMLESHNDTAVAIAEAIAGDTLSFANLMNQRAKEMGAKNTNFVTPNGLDDAKHYTTAYDLALIASEAIKNEEFLKITNTKSYSFQDVEGKCSFSISNKNAFLTMMEGAFGIKTGFTGTAGYCFVGAVERGNCTFISVVLASGWPPNKSYKWKDTIQLMNYGIDNYEYRVLFDGISDYKTLSVQNGKEKTVDTYIKGNASTLVSNKDLVEYRYEFPENGKVKAPVTQGDMVGCLKIFINKEQYAKFDICVENNVEKIDYQYIFMKFMKKFLL